MAVGEGGPELAKQLLKNTWDTPMPKVVLVYLTGKPRQALPPRRGHRLVKATFESGFVNNCVLEFAGPGIQSLPIDFRNGIDVMTRRPRVCPPSGRPTRSPGASMRPTSGPRTTSPCTRARTPIMTR